MKDIDFLPEGYRQQHSQHHERIWRVLVIAGFLAMLSAASLVQFYRLGYARSCLADQKVEHEAATNQDAQLARLQSQLEEANADAELFTYLCHPWPRTQILTALLTPLPDSVTISQLEIRIDPVPGLRRGLAWQRRDEGQGEQGKPLLAASRDLALLREQFDSSPVRAVLSGNTTDADALHRYLSDLDRCRLFASVELDSITSVAQGGTAVPEGTMSFKAIVTVRPGYGQPKGPTGPVQLVRRPAAANAPVGKPNRDREGAEKSARGATSTDRSLTVAARREGVAARREKIAARIGEGKS